MKATCLCKKGMCWETFFGKRDAKQKRKGKRRNND